MRELPILFSARMVRAILADSKTQTRRVAKPDVAGRVARAGRSWHVEDPACIAACPYGQPGDRLWVRETHSIGPGPDVALLPGEDCGSLRWPHVTYAADGAIERRDTPWNGAYGRGRPSIHMPRWASRITLEVTGVRVERLHDISEADAVAEGVEYERPIDPRDAFRSLWWSINGVESWNANPRVWVVEFKRLMPLRELRHG